MIFDNLLPDEDLTKLGDRLRYARRRANQMTQAELARLAGCAQSSVASIERQGKYSQYVPSLAKILNLNAVWLAEGTGPMRPSTDVNGLYNRCSDSTRLVIDALFSLELDTPRPSLPDAAWTILDAVKQLSSSR